ncbi:MAG: cysteine desulfurase [Candidatus Hydrothermales bacterium]
MRTVELTFNVEKIREDFPCLKRKIRGKNLIYFDNAATTQKPKRVIDAIVEFYSSYNANVHRGVHTLSYEASTKYEEAHKKAASFIGASSMEEIIFTRNATEALNLVAYSYGLRELKEGDEVITTIMEHHSNIVPWQMLRRFNKVKLHYVNVLDDGTLDLDHLRKLVNKKTKIVTFTLASNFLGTCNPASEIVKIARERSDAIIVCDGAQAVPHMKVNVKEIDCDFLAVSGHKMLGPTGIGFLYGKKKLLSKMEPFLYGGDMIFEVTTEGATWNNLPWKYEAGTPNIAGGIGLLAAISYLEEIGMENIESHERNLKEYALKKMRETEDIEIYGHKTEDALGIISFNLKGIHPHDVAGICDEEGIAIRSGHHCTQPLMRFFKIENSARVSFYLYNTKEEIDKFIDVLREIKKYFKK